jgi:uncharacterized protein YbaA (DUF1428 family)
MPSFSTRWATELDQFRRARMQFAGLLVHEEGHRHAPVALARDAPVGTVGDHRAGAPAPGREELVSSTASAPSRAASRRLRRRASACIHADEPLRRGAEDDRRLVAPAVRVAVRIFSACLSSGPWRSVRRPSCWHPRSSGRRRCGVYSARTCRRPPTGLCHRQAVASGRHVVVHAVRGRGVHQAGTGLQRDVVAQDHRHSRS